MNTVVQTLSVMILTKSAHKPSSPSGLSEVQEEGLSRTGVADTIPIFVTSFVFKLSLVFSVVVKNGNERKAYLSRSV